MATITELPLKIEAFSTDGVALSYSVSSSDIGTVLLTNSASPYPSLFTTTASSITYSTSLGFLEKTFRAVNPTTNIPSLNYFKVRSLYNSISPDRETFEISEYTTNGNTLVGTSQFITSVYGGRNLRLSFKVNTPPEPSTTVTVAPIVVNSNTVCDTVTKTGTINVSSITGGSGAYARGAIGSTQSQAIERLRTVTTASDVVKILTGSQNSMTFSPLTDGGYYIAVIDTQGVIGISGLITIACNATTTTTTTTSTTSTTSTVNPLNDLIFFEVAFGGNFQTDPQMYYNAEKTLPRAYLEFDFEQPRTTARSKISTVTGARDTYPIVTLADKIIDQKVKLFSNTDGLTANKKYITDNPGIDLCFILKEDFDTDDKGTPYFRLKELWYTNDLQDVDFANGAVSVDPSNPSWQRIDYDPEEKTFVIQSSELLAMQANALGTRILIVSVYEKFNAYEPKINVPDQDKTLEVQIAFSEKDKDRGIEIPYNEVEYANAVYVFIGNQAQGFDPTKYKRRFPIPLDATDGIVYLSYKDDFNGETGEKDIQILPVYESTTGDIRYGNSIPFKINITAVDDYPNLLVIGYPIKIGIPAYGGYNFNYSFSTTATMETDYVVVELDLNGAKYELARLNHTEIVEGTLTPNPEKVFQYSFNVKTTIEDHYKIWDKSKITIVLTPYSRVKTNDALFAAVNDTKGLSYTLETPLEKRLVTLTTDSIKTVLLDLFLKGVDLKAPKENKYISHLANFDNGDKVLVSSWENDNWTLSTKTQDDAGRDVVLPENEVKSVILKLYKPLPPAIEDNTTLWITKPVLSPIIENIVSRGDTNIDFPKQYLRGPNFDVEVNYFTGESTGYESLDTLIFSASVSSSATLIETYVSSSMVDTTDLNIQYVSSSTYLWDNFVHFSSARERLDNFIYKVQLIEAYDTAVSSSQYDPTATGYANSLSVKQSIQTYEDKKSKLIQGFDGFEKFLYTSSSYTTSTSTSMTYPILNGVRLSTTSSVVADWYDIISESATEFDRENRNGLKNNIPSYILDNEENDQLLLFIAMVGQHFDVIYYFNKAIERSRTLTYSDKDGIANRLLYDKLKSFNWEPKNISTNTQLWEYLLGMDTVGNTKFAKSAKDRNNEIWRRIINNLPYLLKHKGTKRAIHALMCCYGIPTYNLSILEFGGPEIADAAGNITPKAKHIVENISNALKFENGSKLWFNWENTSTSRKADTIEIFFTPAYAADWTLISGSGWSINISGSSNSDFGKVLFKSSSTVLISSSLVPLFNGNEIGLGITRTTGVTNHVFRLNVGQYKQERRIFSSSTSATIAAATATVWNNGSHVAIGSGYSGSVDEFRLWTTPLDTARIYEHIAFPEMTNGNHISSSTEDLYFRLDFDYPKNVAVYTTMPNVDNNIYYSQSLSRNDIEKATIVKNTNIFSANATTIYSASLSGFTTIASYPYQFETIERQNVLEMPDLGITRYSTNKIRFESQSLIDNTLLYGQRNTIRAYDNAPMDNNRLGIFFSPTKELNIDIAKSIGSSNLDNYIGDPRDAYKDRYDSLDRLRNYYFRRFKGRDIYAYIDLIKSYEMSLFEDIRQLVPARAKLTTGVLIEPHLLERSKIAWKRPSGETTQYESGLSTENTTVLVGETTQYEANVQTEPVFNFEGENTQYEAEVDNAIEYVNSAEVTQYEGDASYRDSVLVESEASQYEGDVPKESEDRTVQSAIDAYSTTVGASDLEKLGFGIYAENGYAIRTYYAQNGTIKRERVRVSLITRQYTKYFDKYKTVVNGEGDLRDGFIATSSLQQETVLNIQPFTGTVFPAVAGEIVSVIPLNGYATTHYKYVGDLSTGMQNSFFRGCKLSGNSVIDGKPVVEEFNSNPNTLRVNKFGRDTNEPILEVE